MFSTSAVNHEILKALPNNETLTFNDILSKIMILIFM